MTCERKFVKLYPNYLDIVLQVRTDKFLVSLKVTKILRNNHFISVMQILVSIHCFWIHNRTKYITIEFIIIYKQLFFVPLKATIGKAFQYDMVFHQILQKIWLFIENDQIYLFRSNDSNIETLACM